MRFRLACFDLDGTLVDSQEDIRAALAHAFAVVGPRHPALDDLAVSRAGLGQPLEEFFALARPDGDAAALAAFVAAYRAYYHDHLIVRTRPYDGVADTLAHIDRLRARGLRTAVATTKRSDTARRVVEELGLARHFDLVLGTDGIPHKPAPDLLLLAARRLERLPRDGVMIGDTDRDVGAGRAAGMFTCGVAWGALGAAGLRPHAPDRIIERFDEVLALLGE